MSRKPATIAERNAMRERIVATARALFLEQGYEAMSVRKIAGRLGCAPGTLYLYFKNKQDLLRSIWAEALDALHDRIGPVADRSADPVQRIYRILRAYADFALAQPEHFHVVFMPRNTPSTLEAEFQRDPDHHRDYLHLRDAVADAVAQGLFRPVDPDLAAQGVWTAVHGVLALTNLLDAFPWVDRVRLIDHVLATAIAGLTTRPEPAVHPDPA